MKKLMMAMAAAVALAGSAANAATETWTTATETVDGIPWTYQTNGKIARLGTGSTATPCIPTNTTGAIATPTVLGGVPVEIVNGYAFRYCQSVTAITVSGGITNIGNYAFANCMALERLDLPKSLRTIGSSDLFMTSSYVPKLQGIYYAGSLEDWLAADLAIGPVGSTVKFYFNGERLPAGCLTIPSGVESLRQGQLIDGGDVTEVVCPDSLRSLGAGALSSFKSMTTLTLGNNTTNVAYNSLNMSKLNKVVIPANFAAHANLAGLKGVDFNKIEIDPANQNYEVRDNALWSTDGKILYLINLGNARNIVFPDGLEEIGGYMFFQNSSITNVVFPASLRTVGDYAFYYCSGLKNMRLPAGLTKVGSSAFYRVDIKDALFESSVEIGSYAFGYCSSLTNVCFCDSVKIRGNGFYYCTGLRSVVFNGDVEILGEMTFSHCDDLENLVFNGDVDISGHWAFGYCAGIEEIVFNGDVDISGAWAFIDCPDLQMVAFNGDVNISGAWAFEHCENLCWVEFCSANVKIGGGWPFQYDPVEWWVLPSGASISSMGTPTTSGVTVEMQYGSTTFDTAFFAKCSWLKTKVGTLVVPATVTMMQLAAIRQLTNLTKIIFKGAKPSILDADTINYLRTSGIEMETQEAGPAPVREWKVKTQTVGGLTWTYQTDGYSARLGDGESCCVRGTAGTSVIHVPDTLGGMPVLEITPNAFGWGFVVPGVDTIVFDKYVELPSQTFVGTNSIRRVEFGAMATLGSYAFSDSLVESVVFRGDVALEDDSFGDWSNVKELEIGPGAAVGSAFANPLALTLRSGTTAFDTSYLAESPSLKAKVETLVLPASVKSVEKAALQELPNLKKIVFDGCDPRLLDEESRDYLKSQNLEGEYFIDGEVQEWPDLDDEGGGEPGGDVPGGDDEPVAPDDPSNYTGTWTTATQIVNEVSWIYQTNGKIARLGQHCIPTTTAGAVTIPDKLGGLPVRWIYTQAFYFCSSITDLVIGKYVTRIDSLAFYGCSKLANLTVPSSLTTVSTSPQPPLYSCSKLATVTLADDFTNYEALALLLQNAPTRSLLAVMQGGVSLSTDVGIFSPDGKCLICARMATGATAYTVPGSVKVIPTGAFYGMTGLKEVIIPEGVEVIGNSAFSGCRALVRVVVPSTLKELGNSAFANCTNVLESVSVLTNLVRLGYNAFPSTVTSEELVLPDGLVRLGVFPLPAAKITEFIVPDSVKWLELTSSSSFTSPTMTNCVIGSGVTNAIVYVYNPTNLVALSLLSAVPRYMLSGTFPRLERMTVASGIYIMGSFGTNLLEVALAEGTTAFDTAFFSKAGMLKPRIETLVIPASVTTVQLAALKSLTKLKRIIYLGSDQSLFSEAALQDYLTTAGIAIEDGKSGGGSGGGNENPSGWEELLNSYPSVKVIETKPREGDPTVLEVTFAVSNTAETVSLRALAFENGERSFAKVLRMVTFLEGTGEFLGESVTPNRTYTLAWKVSEDWHVDLSKVSVEIMMFDGGLLPLRLATIPATAKHRKMTVTNNAITSAKLMDALYWLYAGGDVELSLENGVLMAGGKTLAEGETPTADGAAFVLGKMGFELLTGEELDYVNRLTRFGLVPNGPRQYGVRHSED